MNLLKTQSKHLNAINLTYHFDSIIISRVCLPRLLFRSLRFVSFRWKEGTKRANRHYYLSFRQEKYLICILPNAWLMISTFCIQHSDLEMNGFCVCVLGFCSGIVESAGEWMNKINNMFSMNLSNWRVEKKELKGMDCWHKIAPIIETFINSFTKTMASSPASELHCFSPFCFLWLPGCWWRFCCSERPHVSWLICNVPRRRLDLEYQSQTERIRMFRFGRCRFPGKSSLHFVIDAVRSNLLVRLARYSPSMALVCVCLCVWCLCCV